MSNSDNLSFDEKLLNLCCRISATGCKSYWCRQECSNKYFVAKIDVDTFGNGSLQVRWMNSNFLSWSYGMHFSLILPAIPLVLIFDGAPLFLVGKKRTHGGLAPRARRPQSRARRQGRRAPRGRIDFSQSLRTKVGQAGRPHFVGLVLGCIESDFNK